jgi:hypothetical protein
LVALAAIPWVVLKVFDRIEHQPPSAVARNWDGLNAVAVGSPEPLSEFSYNHPPNFGLSTLPDGSANGSFIWALYSSGSTRKPILKLIVPLSVDEVTAARTEVEDRLEGTSPINIPPGSVTGLSTEVVGDRKVITTSGQAVFRSGPDEWIHIIAVQFHMKDARTRKLAFKQWEVGFSYNPGLVEDYQLRPLEAAGATYFGDDSTGASDLTSKGILHFYLVGEMQITQSDPQPDSDLSGASSRHSDLPQNGVRWDRAVDQVFSYRAAVADSRFLVYRKWPGLLGTLIVSGIVGVVYALAVGDTGGKASRGLSRKNAVQQQQKKRKESKVSGSAQVVRGSRSANPNRRSRNRRSRKRT